MDVFETGLDGCKLIVPKIFSDNRGYFYESFNQKEFNEKVANITFVQENQSCSDIGVMRGLHFQIPPMAQSKLVRCVSGSLYDVAVDLRKDSKTYGKWIGYLLTPDNHRQLFIPQGFAHGFLALESKTILQYKCDNYYSPKHEGSLYLYDEDLNIDWNIIRQSCEIATSELILSDKDKVAPQFKDFITPF